MCCERPAAVRYLLPLLIMGGCFGVAQAAFLAAVAKGEKTSSLVTPKRATELLGTMLGGYNISPLVDLLDDEELGAVAADQLKKVLLMFDAFYDVEEKHKVRDPPSSYPPMCPLPS